MDDRTVRAALERHWEASDTGDFKAEHEIYREDAVLDYPQSGERIRGRRNIQESRSVQPNKKRFTVRRMIGSGDLWVTEFVLSYDGIPSYTVSIMEFRDGLVASETQYFADRFDPAPSRAHGGKHVILNTPGSALVMRFHRAGPLVFDGSWHICDMPVGLMTSVDRA